MRKLSPVAIGFVAVSSSFWFLSAALAQSGGLKTLRPLPQAAATSPVSDVTMVGTEMKEDDLPSLAPAPDGSLWLSWLSYSDRRDDIALRRYAAGTWGNLQFVPNTSGDVWFPQVAVTANNQPWVVWTQQLDNNWDIYARGFDPAEQGWGPLIRLTEHPLPDINPRLASDGKGRFAVVWQGFRGGKSNIYRRTFEDGEWAETVQVTGRPVNDWEPAVAFDSSGTVWVAYDSYKNGNYDVYLAGVRDGKVAVPEMAIAESPLFEARASVAVDGEDRVWVAWESGGANWGKDTGYTILQDQPGVRLGADREVRIRCYANGRLQAPAEPLQKVFSAGAGEPKWTYQPNVFVDSKGSVRVVAKRQIRVGGEGAAGNRVYYEHWMTRYDGNRWTAASPLPNSWGRLSTRMSAANTADGTLWLAWPTDSRRPALAHRPIRGRIHAGKLAAASSVAPSLTEPQSEPIDVKAGHSNEAADLDAMRGYRTTVAGRPVQIVRGDFHRHTELSWDGGGRTDGSLQDFYRYMIDASAMDFGASTDHQGGGYDYWWWYSQKMTDMHHIPGAYTAIYGYERSVTQPNGHRNIFFADRSGGVTPFFYKADVPAFALGRHPMGDISGVGTRDVARDDTKHLYDEVRRMRGIAISHTSGTRMGTDWRDNDPELEPVVEIFQGARTNYEYVGAPLSVRPGIDDDHASRAGYFPVGFVRNAWEKGYRLGIITSSDPNSTHYSYAMVYTDRPTRQGILDAIRRRHTYGATDNILLDVRMGTHFMGDEFKTSKALPIRVKVRGTRELEKVHIIRGTEIIYTNTTAGPDVSFEFTDNDAAAHTGTQYYYVRVEQVDKQVAWSSPIWVNY